MEHLAHQLINEKVWWHRTLWWRNMSARIAVIYTFMLEGSSVGVWSFYLADIEDNLNLSDSELGTAVLFVYLGMVMVSPFVAWLLKKIGTQYSMIIGALCFGISMSFIPPANSLGLLIFAMLVYGTSMGIMDISANSGAILTEIVEGKPLIGSFHGSYSLAASISPIIAGALKSAHLSIYAVFIGVSSLSVFFTTVLHPNMYNTQQEELITEYKNRVSVAEDSQYSPLLDDTVKSGIAQLKEPLLADDEGEERERNTDQSADSLVDVDNVDGTPSTAPIVSNTTRIIAFYSMVGFLAAFGESGIVTWSIVYFDREMDASSVLKSLGFTCFMVCMAFGRFCLDYLRRKFGRRLIVRLGGLFAASGLGLVALAPDLPSTIIFGCIGFSITGLGLSTLIPTMFSSAGHIPGGAHAGTSIAIVSMFTNSGSIISSPLIGVVSDGFGSLRLAFLFEAVLLALIFPLSWGIPAEENIFKRALPRPSNVSDPDQQRDSKEIFVSHANGGGEDSP